MEFKILKSFRSYQLAVEFHHLAQSCQVKGHLRDQLFRASSSIALNLAEGHGKRTVADRRKFFHIAMGSVRECEAIIELEGLVVLHDAVDILARHVYRLCLALK